ncbi:class F sortase [Halobacillus sp. A1]|uniref:class F sortase n=1 Tax=Halobacillus sp. A1 TaxID=2880262 RepID=UPI0020A6453B|nr:class F sortase [Halobacillus sp. A1]MCP3032908.1 class F sortase [Halobacillus sp. A1]
MVALLLTAYSTDVFANWTNSSEPEEDTRGELSSQSDENLTPPEEDVPLDEEFTILNDQETLEKFQTEKKQEEGITPTHIKIPSIDVDAPIEQVGILDNGQMGVPQEMEKVGWFEPGTKPGENGNSVLAGHVDSKTGPAVFFKLDQLEEGDDIIVSDEEGTELTYTVKRMESYPYTDSPIDEIFGQTDQKNLNLITCTGTFNREAGTHDERLVVYTELVEPEQQEEEEEQELDIQSPTNVEVSGTFITWHAVRVEGVAGYRVYKSTDGENYEKVASVSSHERKSFTDEKAADHSYYVTTVYLDGTESDPSEVAPE